MKQSSIFIAIFTVAIVSLVGFSNHNAYADTITAQQSGNWDDTTTWVGGIIPASTDDVTIPTGKDVTIESGLIVTVTLGRTITVESGGTITIDSGGTLSKLPGSVISNDGDIINSGIIYNTASSLTNLSSGTIRNFGIIYNLPGGPSSVISNDGDIINSGTIINNSEFINNSSGTITNNSGGTINNSDIIWNGGTITNNSGNIINSNTIYNYYTTFNNNNIIIFLPGTIINNSGSSITNNLNAVIRNPVGAITNNCGAIFTNLGTFTGIDIVFNCPTTNVPAATGAGTISFSTSSGGFNGLTAVSQSSLSPPPPSGNYPLGFFSWSIAGFAPATSVTVTMTSPTPIDPTTNYVKLVGGNWVPVTPPALTISGNTITLTITDNGPYDGNPTTGIISDPGAPIVSTNGKVTGGGQIGIGTEFAFDVKSDITKHKTNGNLKYNDKSAKINLESIGISLLSVNPSMTNGTFVGKGNIGKTKGDVNFLVSLTDPDKKGNHDKFSIIITDNSGNIIYQNTGTVKGHIEIHKFSDKNDKSDSG